ncbi:uncharacterized protein N0V89_008091 [Didymosphaeria variabile]|uniref:Rhodopsin domain-containing protein n=1 Tax=Didymosphaeria variabile TaxID=1932322 RepID=A0A9W9C868_9PLEO|nr:uncharacterized protein N0V89_008091 [Didymosphaeria variabile]KAJ4349476.1 hypothetical protein N0V89_008091 [Didymosphaeria variabile]
MVIAHLVHVFTSVRWFKNSGYVIVVATGMIYALYTCTTSIACSPKPDDDLDSYVEGFRKTTCSGAGGANMIVGILMALFNSLADFYLLVATFLLSPSMNVTVKERRVIYLMHFVGVVASVCSILGLVYRIKAYQHVDLTGYQIPIIVSLILEVSISLLIPCMTSFYQIYRHYTYVELNERTTIGTPSTTRYNSTLSYYKSPSRTQTSTPVPDPKTSWRKTHLSVEELPFRKASADFYRKSPLTFQDARGRDSRMKRLPPTPLPMASRNNSVTGEVEGSSKRPKTPKSPKTPKTPNSVRSMRLPILFERR